MTDLATRIADVKKEIEADRITYVSRSLFLAMADRIKELQAKADDWQTMKDELDMAKFGYQAIKEDTDNEIAELRKRNEEMKKALEPFAQSAENFDEEWLDDEYPKGIAISVGHLRTAARAYRGEKG